MIMSHILIRNYMLDQLWKLHQLVQQLLVYLL
ncbi:unnamed protein product [Brugia pahangi]|uniref:Uncharacterized protein n=1 Tax=Brugia pahangi TaxID=6280 RepID=A0A0N4TD55_BRUPA|nr:unnamed protein product [Brugia pahangi]